MKILNSYIHYKVIYKFEYITYISLMRNLALFQTPSGEKDSDFKFLDPRSRLLIKYVLTKKLLNTGGYEAELQEQVRSQTFRFRGEFGNERGTICDFKSRALLPFQTGVWEREGN